MYNQESRVMKRILIVLALSLLVAACGSGVKLNQPEVVDKTGTLVNSGDGSGTAGVGQRDVAPVKLDDAAANQPGPNVARVIYFDYDSYTLKPEFQAAIDSHARFLNANRSRKISIEGHTDERGGREYNLALGQKRAEAVRQALGLLGVTEAQMEAVSFGKEKPAVQGTDEEAMAKNRRAEIAYR